MSQRGVQGVDVVTYHVTTHRLAEGRYVARVLFGATWLCAEGPSALEAFGALVQEMVRHEQED